MRTKANPDKNRTNHAPVGDAGDDQVKHLFPTTRIGGRVSFSSPPEVIDCLAFAATELALSSDGC
jgi:hypothetical protein